MLGELKKELGDTYENILDALFNRDDVYQASCLHHALTVRGTDEKTLIDIICSKTKEELQKIVQVYKSLYERELAEDIGDKTTGSGVPMF